VNPESVEGLQANLQRIEIAAIQGDDVVILHFPDTVTPLEAVEWREVFSQLTGITNRVVAFVGDVRVEVKRPEPGQ